MIKKLVKLFRRKDDGAVTVDWVVLTAAILTLGTASACQMQGKIMTKVYTTEL
jgi:hypothetical protein